MPLSKVKSVPHSGATTNTRAAKNGDRRHMWPCWQKSKCSGAAQTVAVHTEENQRQSLQQSL